MLLRWERGKVDMLVGRSGAMAVAHSGKHIFIIGELLTSHLPVLQQIFIICESLTYQFI